MFNYLIYDGYLIIKEEKGYHITDEVLFDEYYSTLNECMQRIAELKAEECYV